MPQAVPAAGAPSGRQLQLHQAPRFLSQAEDFLGVAEAEPGRFYLQLPRHVHCFPAAALSARSMREDWPGRCALSRNTPAVASMTAGTVGQGDNRVSADDAADVECTDRATAAVSRPRRPETLARPPAALLRRGGRPAPDRRRSCLPCLFQST